MFEVDENVRGDTLHDLSFIYDKLLIESKIDTKVYHLSKHEEIDELSSCFQYHRVVNNVQAELDAKDYHYGSIK